MSRPHDANSRSAPLLEGQKTGADRCVVQVGDPDLKPKDYRKLAICSIVCGLSCLGIMSLMYSVKTREFNKRPHEGGRPKAKKYSSKALKFGVLAILAWVILIVLFPLFLGLLSYLLTFMD